MSAKRKDNKGRILKTGESQRKDWIYQYRYTDFRGKRQSVYAPTLQELRQKEKEIQKQVDDGIDYEAGQITVIELLEKYISLKKRGTLQHPGWLQFRFESGQKRGFWLSQDQYHQGIGCEAVVDEAAKGRQRIQHYYQCARSH